MNTHLTHRPQGLARLTALALALVISFVLVAMLAAGNARAAGTAAPTKHATGAILPKKLHRPEASLHELATLPAAVDLRQYTVSPGNQGAVASCVTWAIDYALLGWWARRTGQPVTGFNPMFTYSQIHADNSQSGGGSSPETALSYAQTYGNDEYWHYNNGNTNDFTHQPTTSERTNASNYEISGYRNLFSGYTAGSVGGIDLIKGELAAGRPVPILMYVRTGMDINHMGHTSDAVDHDTTSPRQAQAHEVLAVGYDANGLVFQNSWGTGYGFGGFGRLGWDVVAADVFRADAVYGISFKTATAADTTGPAMGAVGSQFMLDGQATSTTVPVRFSWSATDASGINSYMVYVSTDGGTYQQDTSISATATSVSYSLSTGHRYQLAVKAKDGAGNWSGYQYSSAVTPKFADNTSFSLPSPWTTYPLGDTVGGSYTASNQAGSWVQYTATGTDIAVIAPKFSTAGRATLYCDGTGYGLFDTYSATTVGRKVTTWCHFAQSGSHTIKLVVEGTSGRPWIGIDGFAALS